MIKKLVLGAVVGGIIVFAWGAVSWMALPWHEATLQRFSNEAQIAVAVRSGAHRDGVYFLPNAHHGEAPTA